MPKPKERVIVDSVTIAYVVQLTKEEVGALKEAVAELGQDWKDFLSFAAYLQTTKFVQSVLKQHKKRSEIRNEGVANDG